MEPIKVLVNSTLLTWEEFKQLKPQKSDFVEYVFPELDLDNAIESVRSIVSNEQVLSGFAKSVLMPFQKIEIDGKVYELSVEFKAV